ncbi:hypothetical protein B0H14DRAFT_3138991 [Mycena olivaceomarginata]|nr:hypothetical protein B0H14DRAFT_3138991 [Mycena olivaceomarginata]
MPLPRPLRPLRPLRPPRPPARLPCCRACCARACCARPLARRAPAEPAAPARSPAVPARSPTRRARPLAHPPYALVHIPACAPGDGASRWVWSGSTLWAEDGAEQKPAAQGARATVHDLTAERYSLWRRRSSPRIASQRVEQRFRISDRSGTV